MKELRVGDLSVCIVPTNLLPAMVSRALYFALLHYVLDRDLLVESYCMAWNLWCMFFLITVVLHDVIGLSACALK